MSGPNSRVDDKGNCSCIDYRIGTNKFAYGFHHVLVRADLTTVDLRRYLNAVIPYFSVFPIRFFVYLNTFFATRTYQLLRNSDPLLVLIQTYLV